MNNPRDNGDNRDNRGASDASDASGAPDRHTPRDALDPTSVPGAEPTRNRLLHEEQLEDERFDNQGGVSGEEGIDDRRGTGIPAIDDVRSDFPNDEDRENR